MENSTLILDSKAVKQKLNRMAYQILEDVYQDEEVVFLGIAKNGYLIAEQLAELVNPKKPVQLVKVSIDKEKPSQNEVKLSVDIAELAGKVVVIFDDVANTGRILTYATKPLLEIPTKKIRVVVLVDRKHKRYPISADIVGLSLATTHQEHISVQFSASGQASVYLD